MDTVVELQIPSPCVDVCALDQQDVCIGCGRSLDEIGRWMEATETEKAAVLARARQRLALTADVKQPTR